MRLYSLCRAVLPLFAVAAAAACGTDFATPTTNAPGSASSPVASVPGGATPTPGTVSPPDMMSPTLPPGVEGHPLVLLNGELPRIPDVQPTAAPGNEFVFQRRSDSFPAEGLRPYVEIRWNMPLRVASDEQRALVELLERIPLTAESSSRFQFGDYESWRSLIGFDLPVYEDGAEAFIEEFMEVLVPGVDPRSLPLLPGGGPWLSGFTDYMADVKSFGAMGIDQRNVDQVAVAGGSSSQVEVIAGRYDPELTMRLLAECECPQPAVTSYGGYEYWSWGGGEPSLRHSNSPPVFDEFGRGGHVLMTDNGLYRTFTVPLMEQLIDTLNGAGPSLADAESVAFALDVMAANNVPGVTISNGEDYAVDAVLPAGDGRIEATMSGNRPVYEITHESNRANALLVQPLEAFDQIAMGNGWDGESQFSLVILSFEHRAAALVNAGLLAHRIIGTNSNDGLPWALRLPAVEISVSGRHVVARFPYAEAGNYLSPQWGQLLFVHE